MVFCEGRHDIVFVQRSLGTVGGCCWVNKPVKDLPSPFGASPAAARGLIARRTERLAVGTLKLQAAVRAPLPHFESVLQAVDLNTVFVLVRTLGKDQTEATLELLEDLKLTMGEEAPAGNFDVSQYATAFVFDANDMGVADTLENFRKKYSVHFKDLAEVKHGRWTTANHMLVGCFVFCKGDGVTTGTLEDHLAPMAESAWPERYSEARSFIDDNAKNGDAVCRSRAKRLKAVITVTGQFRQPGDPMSEIIGRHGLPRQQFEESPLSKELAGFLTSVPWDEPLSASGSSIRRRTP